MNRNIGRIILSEEDHLGTRTASGINIYQSILSGNYHIDPGSEKIWRDAIDAEIRNATLIHIDNVIDYYITGSTPDLPTLNIAPPWQSFFMQAPKYPYAALFKAYPINPELDSDKKRFGGLVNEQTKWFVAILIFAIMTYRETKIPSFFSYIPIGLDKDGLIQNQRDDGSFGVAIDPIWENMEEDYYDDWVHASQAVLSGCSLAITFCHCKNVEIIETVPQHTRAMRRRNEPVKKSFHTIHINPIKKILKTEGQSETLGLNQALHICRGHFKNYQGRGLFGKYQGTYWWPMHARGSDVYGKIVQDYKISNTEKTDGR